MKRDCHVQFSEIFSAVKNKISLEKMTCLIFLFKTLIVGTL